MIQMISTSNFAQQGTPRHGMENPSSLPTLPTPPPPLVAQGPSIQKHSPACLTHDNAPTHSTSNDAVIGIPLCPIRGPSIQSNPIHPSNQGKRTNKQEKSRNGHC